MLPKPGSVDGAGAVASHFSYVVREEDLRTAQANAKPAEPAESEVANRAKKVGNTAGIYIYIMQGCFDLGWWNRPQIHLIYVHICAMSCTLQVSTIRKQFPNLNVHMTSVSFYWQNDFRKKFNVGNEYKNLLEAAKMAHKYELAAEHCMEDMKSSSRREGHNAMTWYIIGVYIVVKKSRQC